MKKEDIPIWQSRIKRAEDLQAEHSSVRKQILKLYLGEFFCKPTDTDGDVTEVNFVFEFVKVVLSSIYARDPHIFCRAMTKRTWKFAETMETVLNYYWREKEIKQKIKSCIVDGILQPPGWIGLGYLFLKEKNQTLRDLEEEIPELKKVEKTAAEQGKMDETVKDDDVFAEQVSSWDVLWPDGYHNIRHCPYLVIRQKITLEDLENDPTFNNNKYKVYGGALGGHQPDKKPGLFRMQDDVPMVSPAVVIDKELIDITLYHVWDRRSMKRFCLAKNFNDGELYEKDWVYLPEGFPLFPLIFNEVPQTDEKSNSYPLSDVVPMLPQLKELSRITSSMMRHRKRAGTLILGKKGLISETDASLIQNSKDVDLILLDDVGETAVKGFTPPPLPADFYRLREVILDDLMRSSGYQQFLGNVRGVETATESENMRAGAKIRQSEKVDVIEDFTVDIARYLAGLIWQFKQDAKGRREISEIIGEPVNEEMWPVLPEDQDEARRIIQKEISFRIDAGSTRPPKDEAVERKQWSDVIGIIKANFPGRLKDDVILPQLLKKFDFKDIDSAVIGFDDEETARAQKENQLLMRGVPVPVGPNDNHKIHLQVHSTIGQVPGLQPTKQADEHLLEHAQWEQRINPQITPQRGDVKASPRSTTPEARRQGVTTASDLLGAVNNMAGVGGERGPTK